MMDNRIRESVCLACKKPGERCGGYSYNGVSCCSNGSDGSDYTCKRTDTWWLRTCQKVKLCSKRKLEDTKVKSKGCRSERVIPVDTLSRVPVDINTVNMKAGTFQLELEITATDAGGFEEKTIVPVDVEVDGIPTFETYVGKDLVTGTFTHDLGVIGRGMFVGMPLGIRNEGQGTLLVDVYCSKSSQVTKSRSRDDEPQQKLEVLAQTDGRFMIGVKATQTGPVSETCVLKTFVGKSEHTREFLLNANVIKGAELSAEPSTITKTLSRTDVFEKVTLTIHNKGDMDISKLVIVADTSLHRDELPTSEGRGQPVRELDELSEEDAREMERVHLEDDRKCTEAYVGSFSVSVSATKIRCRRVSDEAEEDGILVADIEEYPGARMLYDGAGKRSRRIVPRTNSFADSYMIYTTGHIEGYGWMQANWIDINKHTGQFIEFFAGKDDASAMIDFPDFTFSYFGELHKRALVTLNGYITFDTWTFDEKQNLVRPPMKTIAPFLEDLIAGNHFKGVFVGKSDGVLVISWLGMGRLDDKDANLSFQVQLLQDGTIRFVYLPTGFNVNSHTRALLTSPRLSGNTENDTLHITPVLKHTKFSGVRPLGVQMTPWLLAETVDSRIPAGGTATITVRINTAARSATSRTGAIRVMGWDARRKQVKSFMIPVIVDP